MSARWRQAAWIAQPLVIVAILFITLGGRARDWRVPLTFSADGLYYLVQSKTTIEQGWWWTNPSIGAPSVYDAPAFAQNSNVDQAIVWILHWATRDAALVVTAAWIAMMALAGVTSSWCLRRLGVSRMGAWVCGVLFALSPYAFYRGTTHFNLAIYLIPFPAAAAMLLASGWTAADGHGTRYRGIVLGNILLGFNFIYYAAFGVCAIAGGALIGLTRGNRRAVLATAFVTLLAIVAAVGVNQIPTIMAWRREGVPTTIRAKAPREAELYGLKIRQLVSPLPDHWFPPFRAWVARERKADFPLETENSASRLGVVATIGFLGLLGALLFPSLAGRDETTARRIQAAAALTFAALVVATIGGLGGVFNLLVAPDIRAYTRVTPFLSFFALAGLALWIDQAIRRTVVKAGVFAVLLVAGVSDQIVAARVLASDPETTRAYHDTQALVGRMESALPAGAMVLQLPFSAFPSYGDETMPGYEHFRPYVVSHTLRWTYPALSNARVRWQERMAAVPLAELPQRAAEQRFDAILLDRRGYDDNGAAAIATLRQALGDASVITEDARYLALDLRRLPGATTR